MVWHVVKKCYECQLLPTPLCSPAEGAPYPQSCGLWPDADSTCHCSCRCLLSILPSGRRTWHSFMAHQVTKHQLRWHTHAPSRFPAAASWRETVPCLLGSMPCQHSLSASGVHAWASRSDGSPAQSVNAAMLVGASWHHALL